MSQARPSLGQHIDTHLAMLTKRLLGTAAHVDTAARIASRGFVVRRSIWMKLKDQARQPSRNLGHIARRLVDKSKRKLRRMYEALRRRPDKPLTRLTTRSVAPHSPASGMQLLALEPRIVFDAAAVATADQASENAQQHQAESAAPGQSASTPPDDVVFTDAATDADPLPQQRHEIAFVDGSVSNVAELIAGIDPSFEIVMLDRTSDGVEQMAAVLRGRMEVDAIHILSHGSDGRLDLGNGVLDAISIGSSHADELATIRGALSTDADILIYGCNVASGENGRAFVSALAAATGADVAASTDDTGTATRGGDWDLETRQGLIESSLIDAPEWNGLLAPVNISATTAPVVRDNTGTIVTGVNTGGVVRHITDVTKMVGATATWGNAGFVGSTAIDLRATVMAVTDTNSAAGLAFDPSLNFAISNGDDPSVRIESAEVRIKWEVFAAGTNIVAAGDVGFFIRDIDAFGNLLDGTGAVQYVNLAGPKPQESVRADFDELSNYQTESLATTHLIVGLNIDPDTGATITNPAHSSFGKITATNLTATELAGSVSGVKFNWTNVAAWETTYRVAPPPGVLPLDGPYTFNGVADLNNNFATQGQRFFDHDGDGDLTFVAPYTVDMRSLDLDANNSTAPGTAATVTFTENGSAVSVVDADVDISGLDTRVVSATVALTNAKPGDELLVGGSAATSGTVNGLSYTITNASGVIRVLLSGNVTDPTIYETALKQITFQNASENPDTTDRLINVSFSNGTVTSNVALSTIDVVAVNDAPSSTDDSVTTAEDTPKVLGLTDFGTYADPEGGAIAFVRFTALETDGSLEYFDGSAWVAVTLNQVVTAADITGGKLRAVPDANEIGTAYATVGFQVSDGTAFAAASNTLTVEVTPVNDAPAGADKTLAMVEDTTITLTVADFGFSDPHDAPANTLQDVKISSLPLNGTLSYNGTAITAAQISAGYFVTAADIAAGKISFTPPANANGTAYASFSFQVRDNGGTASGGVALDPTPNTIIIDVTPVADAVTAIAPSAQTTPEDASIVFSTANGNAIEFDDPDNSVSGNVIVKLSVPNGTLQLGGTSGLVSVSGNGSETIIVTGTMASITTALDGLNYTPPADFYGAVGTELSITVTRPADLGFLDSGFEQPAFASGVNFALDSAVPGWDTTATDHKIEFWSHGALGVAAFEGSQFVELNAFEVSTLSQTFTPSAAGGDLTVTFAHRGRSGADTMRVTATDLGADGVLGGGDDTVLFTQTYTDGNTAWQQYQADLGTATGNPIRLAFESVNSVGGPTIGNFLDAISIYDSSLSTTATMALTVTSVVDIVADTVTTTEDTPLTFNVMTGSDGASADNFESLVAAVTSITQPSHGSVSFSANGSMTYTPAKDFTGTDTFTYTVATANNTETTTVTVTVTPVADAPLATDNRDGSTISDGAMSGISA